MLILVHGLGQDEKSWTEMQEILSFENETAKISNSKGDFELLYADFEKKMLARNEKITLCGLSLGGLLSLKFAIQNPEKVEKLILIATPYKIPKLAFKFQNMVFSIMPEKFFKKMNQTKQNVLDLTNSLAEINFEKELEKLQIKTLVLVGEKDFANKKTSKKMAEILPNSKFEIISNSSHEVNVKNPAKLARQINRFLEEN